MKNKSVQNCRFVHHAKFPCIMTSIMLNRFFKIEFEKVGGGGELEKSRNMLLIIKITLGYLKNGLFPI